MKSQSLLRAKHYAVAIFLLMISFNLNAQDIAANPGTYMTTITNAEMEMNKSYLAYMSAVAHSRRAKRVEKMRQRTLKSILDCKFKIARMPYFKGDNSLRKSNMDYTAMCYKIFNEDYAHIVNMEDLIERSFDEMQLYILLQEETDKRLQEAVHKVDSASKAFAQKYHVTIINVNNKISKNLETASKVNHYRNQLFLLFFKCNWEDGQITKALNAKKLTGLEEARNALGTYAKEGLLALDSLNNFQGDHTLALACKWALQFYQKLAENDLPKFTDFFLKEENFNKIKRAIESKPKRSLTKKEIDNYNKAVNEYNASITAFNQLNESINDRRKQCITDWNNADKKFMDTHIPHVR